MFLSEGVKELLVSMRLPPTNFSQGRIYSKVYKKWNIYIYIKHLGHLYFGTQHLYWNWHTHKYLHTHMYKVTSCDNTQFRKNNNLK